MKYRIHFHCGSESKISNELLIEIKQVIEKCEIKIKRNASIIRKELLACFMTKGWPTKIRLDTLSKISVTSMKLDIGLCLQTGNISRLYADLLKLQTLYSKKMIKVGVLILPINKAAKALGSNIANYERLMGELKIFESVITMPLVIIGIE